MTFSVGAFFNVVGAISGANAADTNDLDITGAAFVNFRTDVGANLDTITTIPKAALTKRLNKLPAEKIAALERAQRFALGLPLK